MNITVTEHMDNQSQTTTTDTGLSFEWACIIIACCWTAGMYLALTA